MSENNKSVRERIKSWFSSKENWTIVTSVVAVIALIFTARQVYINRSQLEASLSALDLVKDELEIARDELEITRSELDVSTSALEIARDELEATTRPYLSIDSVEVIYDGDKWESIAIEVVNRGELPAMGLDFENITVGGKEIYWTGYIPEDYDVPTYTMEDGITVNAYGFVFVPERNDFPSDIALYPGRNQPLLINIDESTTGEAIIGESVMEIQITYHWGEGDYWYLVSAILLSNNKWDVVMERGN